MLDLLYVVSSTIIQMVSRGFTWREFAGRSSFGIKFTNPSDTCLHEVCTAFFKSRLSNLCLVTYTHTVVLKTLIDKEKLNLFFAFPFWGTITHILSAVSIIILTQFVKKRPSTPWFVFKVFTFDHLFGYRSDFFNNLAILKQKNRCLSSSTNIVDLHFHEGVEKIKENVKNTKIENLQSGQEKYGGKTSRACVYSWGKI